MEQKDSEKGSQTQPKGITAEEHERQIAALQSSLDKQILGHSKAREDAEAKVADLEEKLGKASSTSGDAQAVLDARKRELERREKELEKRGNELTTKLLEAKKAELLATYPQVKLTEEELKGANSAEALELVVLRKAVEKSGSQRVDTGAGSSVSGSRPQDLAQVIRQGIDAARKGRTKG